MESVITRVGLNDDPAFRDTAERLKGLESDTGTPAWHQVGYAGGRFEA